MSTMAAGFELKELDRRIVSADAELITKKQQLDEQKTALREAGVTAQTISIEDAKALTEAQKEIDGLKDDVIVLRDLRQGMFENEAVKRGPGNREAVQTVRWGGFHAALFGTDAYLAAGITPERFLSQAQVGPTPPIQILTHEQTILHLEYGIPMFAVAAAADLDAGIPLDERLFPTVDILRRQIRLLDLITVGSTTSDTVVFSRQTVRTSNAAETDLGVAYSESLFDFEQDTAPVRDIGHFTTAHRSNIADAGQFDTLVRRQLEEDVMLRLESQIYAGNGAGFNLTGITTEAIEEVDRDTTNETRIDAAHRAITKCRLNFREPTAFVVHPNDYQDIVFEKDGDERHLLIPPGFTSAAARPVMSLWGLPLVVSPVATEGTGLVGFWPDATLWVRSGVSLSVSDSHEDYFTKRQVAILAEMRGAFSVQRPGAFCAINFI